MPSSATAATSAPKARKSTVASPSVASNSAFQVAVQRALSQLADSASAHATMRAAAACREELLARWAQTQAEDCTLLSSNTKGAQTKSARRVHYMSMEFLMGRALTNALSALQPDDALNAHLKSTGLSLPQVLESEADAALGNGGLDTAKLIVNLMHDVARVVNSDVRLRNRLKLVFLPNYSVSLDEVIIPAADLSEQISTAGTEASGTGNMNLALNGAITIGTWDGANTEMGNATDPENMFVFGLRADAVAKIKSLGYEPRLCVEENRPLSGVLNAISAGDFSPGEPARYRALVNGLLAHDTYLLMADFADYVATQERVDALYRTPAAWADMALHNIAGMVEFSVDRTIREYVERVWTLSARSAQK